MPTDKPPYRTLLELASEIAADAAIEFYGEWSGGAVEDAKHFFRRGLANRIHRHLCERREGENDAAD